MSVEFKVFICEAVALQDRVNEWMKEAGNIEILNQSLSSGYYSGTIVGTVFIVQYRVTTAIAPSPFSPKNFNVPLCPQCSTPMTERFRKSDSKPFWGCTDFPDCRGIVNIEDAHLHMGKADLSPGDDCDDDDYVDDDYGSDIPF